MALADPALPYGLRDVKLRQMNSDGTLQSSVDLPVGMTFSFKETEEYEELRGDDRLIAIHGKGPEVEWELEAGGISLDAWKILTGGTITNSGSGTTEQKSFTKKTTDSRPYFQVEGLSIGDDGGSVYVKVYKCKCDGDLEGEWADGSFFTTKVSGRGLGNSSDQLYTITWDETALTSLTATNNELQEILIDSAVSAGTFTLTYSGQTTSAIAYNASAATIQTALEALSNIGVGEALVSGSVGGPFTVEFALTLGGTNLTQMTCTPTLTGGSMIVRTLRNGG